MPCKYLETCKYDVTLEQFTDYCVTIPEEEFDGCPCPTPPHLKNPNDWKHYIRITYDSLHRKEIDE